MRTPFLKPRKKNRPKATQPVFKGVRSFDLDTRLVPFAFFEAIKRGDGDAETYFTIVFRILAGLEMCKLIQDSGEQGDAIKKALGSLWFVGNRIQKQHKVTFLNQEGGLIWDALTHIDNMHPLLTPKEHREIVNDVCVKVGGFSLTLQTLEPYKEDYDV